MVIDRATGHMGGIVHWSNKANRYQNHAILLPGKVELYVDEKKTGAAIVTYGSENGTSTWHTSPVKEIKPYQDGEVKLSPKENGPVSKHKMLPKQYLQIVARNIGFTRPHSNGVTEKLRYSLKDTFANGKLH